MGRYRKIIKISMHNLKCANIRNNINNKLKIDNFAYLKTKKDNKSKKIKKGNCFSKKEKIKLIVSGAVIGFLNGFFGGGGGMICVPILQKVLKLESKQAHATAIAVIFPLSVISAFIYVFNGYIQSLPLLTTTIGVVCGGILGAFALKMLPPKTIRIIFALIMFVGGIKLII